MSPAALPPCKVDRLCLGYAGYYERLSLPRTSNENPSSATRINQFGFITDLVNHVTLRMPTLISHVPIFLHELFQNGSLAASALSGKARRVVVMTICVLVVLIIRVVGAEQCRTYGACEVFDVKFLLYRKSDDPEIAVTHAAYYMLQCSSLSMPHRISNKSDLTSGNNPFRKVGPVFHFYHE